MTEGDHIFFRGMLPALSARYSALVFDNRGVGQAWRCLRL